MTDWVAVGKSRALRLLLTRAAPCARRSGRREVGLVTSRHERSRLVSVHCGAHKAVAAAPPCTSLLSLLTPFPPFSATRFPFLVLCRVVSCSDMWCYVVSCIVVSCCAMPCCAVPCCVGTRYILFPCLPFSHYVMVHCLSARLPVCLPTGRMLSAPSTSWTATATTISSCEWSGPHPGPSDRRAGETKILMREETLHETRYCSNLVPSMDMQSVIGLHTA